MMIRTQVYLPEELHRELMMLVNQEETKYSHLVRRGIQHVIEVSRSKRKKGKLPLAGFIGAGGKGGPKDLSSKVDYYLYGGGSKWALSDAG